MEPFPFAFHLVPDEPDEATRALAFLDCFRTPAGHIVLRSLYWGHLMRLAPEGEVASQRQIGKMELFREIIDRMQAGEAVRSRQDG